MNIAKFSKEDENDRHWPGRRIVWGECKRVGYDQEYECCSRSQININVHKNTYKHVSVSLKRLKCIYTGMCVYKSF